LKRVITLILIFLTAVTGLSSCVLLLTDVPGDRIGNSSRIETDSDFTVYFIDVGQADSALIISDGAVMLIDGGNVADSDLIYTFLMNRGITHLDYIVATHAHEDHVGGPAGALNYAEAARRAEPGHSL
jgi:competence protein ComEC